MGGTIFKGELFSKGGGGGFCVGFSTPGDTEGFTGAAPADVHRLHVFFFPGETAELVRGELLVCALTGLYDEGGGFRKGGFQFGLRQFRV